MIIVDVFSRFDIKPNQESLYRKAFTHTSYANEHGTTSYERLEYLGDAVMELVISEYLYKNTEKTEGEMTKIRSYYVCENAHYEYSKKLGLNEYVLLGNGEEESGGRDRKAIIADIYEAFIGAIFLDQGFLFVKDFIYKYIVPIIEDKNNCFFNDYKSILQEFVQTDKRSLVYHVVDETGPAHNKTFTVVVKIDDILYGKGVAGSKKEAEQLAAKDALQKAQNGR
ncbi:MAG: ribonuclease III [Bacilli bacterium]|nr:ribonuclease III [Bacilli bacterium]